MDKKEGSSTNFMPDDLLEVICILERGKKHYLYKIIRKRNYFSLITKFPAKNGEPTPLKNCASARGTATHQDQREFSSDDKLPNKRRKRRRNKSSHASRSASQQKDKKLKDSSDVRLAQQKPKKKSSARGASQHWRPTWFYHLIDKGVLLTDLHLQPCFIILYRSSNLQPCSVMSSCIHLRISCCVCDFII